MTEIVSQREQLARKAQAKRDKKGTQVKSDTLLSRIVAFLNGSKECEHVDGVYPTDRPLSQVESSFNKVITENKYDDLVAAVNDGEHVWLTLMITRSELKEYFENEENGQVEDAPGVEVEA